MSLRISQLPAATTLTGAELVPVVQGGVTSQTPISTFASGQIAATYAAARLLVGVNTGDRLQVLGRTTQSDGGQGLFTWVAGGSTTVDEGYVLQATGGTWQRIDPSPTAGETLLNAVWFNIKPTNADTVNDAGFAKLKAQMQTSGTTTWRVYFPPGAYTYTNNRWLFGVMKVIIEAYDCTFQCTSSGSDKGPFQVNDLFTDYGDLAFPGTGVYANGYLFNTATAGSTSITTTTAADAGNFTPGMRVVLHGYDQQGPAGYPPNMRYFEYLTVLTAVAGTGVVTFTDRLQNFYDSRWWDTANVGGIGKAYGAPRILSLERANYTRAKLIWFKGFTILANPNGRATPQITADLTIWEDVSAPCFNTMGTGTHIIRRCTFKSNVSGDTNTGDKFVDRLVIEDSTLDGLIGGQAEALDGCVACNSVFLSRTKFFGYIGFFSPRSGTIDDCDIIQTSAQGIGTAGTNPVRAMNIANTRVYNNGSLNYGFTNQPSPGNSLTVGSVVGTDIRITFDATGKAVAYNIEYGMTLTNTVTGNTGVITAIYYETGSPGTLRIAGTWAAPTAADIFYFYDVMKISDGGGNVTPGANVPFWRGPPGPSLPTADLTGTNITKINFPSLNGPGATGIKATSSPLAHEAIVLYTKDGTERARIDDRFLTLATGVGIGLSDRPIDYFEAGNATAIAGSATLVGGTKTVTNTVVTNANYRIRLTRHAAGGTLGHLSYSIIDNTSFTITSSSGTDTSTIEWWLHYNF